MAGGPGFDPAGITNTVGCPVLRVLVLGEGRAPRTHTQRGFCRTDKSCAGSIATHPCKKRKDGAPSVGMVHAKIVKGGPPVDQAFTLRTLSERNGDLT